MLESNGMPLTGRSRRLATTLFLIAMGSFIPLPSQAGGDGEIFFVQMSDTHWGFDNPKVNPEFATTLKRGIAEVNALERSPDFLIFSGDETHATGDAALRRQRMAQFKEISSSLNVADVKYLPGEHDAGLDAAQAYKEYFGETHYSFDVKGVHFIALDNVSAPDGSLGSDQLDWLAGLLAGFDKDSQVILFAHRPLIDVYAPWDWRTKDGAKALELLKPFKNATLFYGHIHQKRVDAKDGFTQYAAQGMMFPLPAPGSTDKPNPVAWDAARPFSGLGFRTVLIDVKAKKVTVTEYPIAGSGVAAADAADDMD